MAITVTSTRLSISPETPVAGVYAMIPKNSIAFVPADGSWIFHVSYYLTADARKSEKVYEYFRSLGDAKPEEWTESQWAKAQAVKTLQVGAVFGTDTHTTENLGISDPTDLTDALVKIYTWYKANCEPISQDVLSDPPIADLVNAFFIANGV